MTYAVALPNTGSPQAGLPKPGEFAPEGSAFLAKCASKTEAQKWVKANRERVRVLVGDSPIVYTTNRGKVLK
jgi:hypothetical protein